MPVAVRGSEANAEEHILTEYLKLDLHFSPRNMPKAIKEIKERESRARTIRLSTIRFCR